jgi:hypothetical protein
MHIQSGRTVSLNTFAKVENKFLCARRYASHCAGAVHGGSPGGLQGLRDPLRRVRAQVLLLPLCRPSGKARGARKMRVLVPKFIKHYRAFLARLCVG